MLDVLSTSLFAYCTHVHYSTCFYLFVLYLHTVLEKFYYSYFDKCNSFNKPNVLLFGIF